MTRYEGGCHCGLVRFWLQTESKEAVECNCSICTKKGFLHLIVPEAQFGISRGEGDLTVYTFNTGTAKHMFCRTCGVHAFYRPRSHPDAWDVNLRCLDGDQWTRFSIKPFDGRNWEDSMGAARLIPPL